MIYYVDSNAFHLARMREVYHLRYLFETFSEIGLNLNVVLRNHTQHLLTQLLSSKESTVIRMSRKISSVEGAATISG